MRQYITSGAARMRERSRPDHSLAVWRKLTVTVIPYFLPVTLPVPVISFYPGLLTATGGVAYTPENLLLSHPAGQPGVRERRKGIIIHAMTEARQSSARIIRWERGMAAATFFSVVMLGVPLALVAGLIEFAALRRRRPFVAAYGLQAALWQVGYNLLSAVIVDLLWNRWPHDAYPSVLALMTDALQQPWQTLAPSTQQFLLLLLAGWLLNLAVAGWGAAMALRGRYFHLPLPGRWLRRVVPEAA